MIDLRAERERQNLSLEEAAARARIPVRYVDALERGDEDILPASAFRIAYQRQYLDSLGLDPDSPVGVPLLEEPTMTTTMQIDEMPLGRLVVAGFLLTMAVVLSLRVASEFTGTSPSASVSEEAAEPDPIAQVALPTSRLRLRAIEDTHLSTRVDGFDSFDGVLPAKEILDLDSRQRIEVWVSDLTTVRITYNGDRIEPLGNLSHGRRLVFIQE
jgi:transcriptional regulator with XRE-family HTH domain